MFFLERESLGEYTSALDCGIPLPDAVFYSSGKGGARGSSSAAHAFLEHRSNTGGTHRGVVREDI